MYVCIEKHAKLGYSPNSSMREDRKALPGELEVALIEMRPEEAADTLPSV